MPIDLASLKSELTTDPLSLGYAPLVAAGACNALADLINAIRQTISVNAGILPAYTVFEAIVPSDWANLSADNKQRIQSILAMGSVDTTGPNTRAAFTAAFAAGTATRTNLTTLLTRLGSRAEALFGAGTAVSADLVAKALAS